MSEAEFFEGMRLDDSPTELKKAGNGLSAVWNPKAKRALDVSLVHTFSIAVAHVVKVKFSADCKFLATVSGCEVRVFDVATGETVRYV